MAPFISNPKRDASDAIAGFVFQVNRTILRWLELKTDEVLELERGEDLDLVQVGETEVPDPRILEQFKMRSAPLSLRSSDALVAVAHFCEHRKTNPSARLSFRFITTGRLAKEKAWNLPGTAIELWMSINRGQLVDSEQDTALEAIRRFLQTCSSPTDLAPTTWAFLEEIIAEENRPEFLDLIQAFEWSLGVVANPHLEDEIKRALVASAYATDTIAANVLFQRLFLYVFKRLCQKGLKRLTTAELHGQLDLVPLTENDESILVFLQDLRGLARRVEALERKEEQSEQLLASLQSQTAALGERIQASIHFTVPNATLDPPTLVEPSIPRSKTVSEILSQLPRKTWISVVGEPGAGKTQLCLLTANQSNTSALWINLRTYSPEQACNVLDASLEAASGIRSHLLVGEWYREAASRLGPGKLLVLDDLPRVASGGALWQRLDILRRACEQQGLRMLSATYFKLPGLLTDSNSIIEIHSPRFTTNEISELFIAHGAPDAVASPKLAEFLMTLTGGLPILISAGVRLLKSNNWRVSWEAIQSFFSGDYARGIKQDAKVMIESTVSQEARELLYRLTCVIGPITKEHIEKTSRVPTEIKLGLEKLDQLVGLWVQPYSKDTYMLSPLVEPTLSNLLNSETRRGVHTLLGFMFFKQKAFTPLDVVTCVHHFQQADLLNQAAIVLIRALLSLTELDQEVPDEALISTIWTSGPLPESLDLDVRLHLRALQIGFADKRGQEFSSLLQNLERLMAEAQALPGSQIGIFMASGFIAIRFARKYPSIANKYVLATVRSASKAVLPDGTKPPMPDSITIESLLWVTANATNSDEDVLSWIETLTQFAPEQLIKLAESEFAPDSSAVMCDLVWLREYRKPESEQNWLSRDAILQRIEGAASEVGLGILWAAAVRTRLTLLSESLGKLDSAVAFAEEQLPRASSDPERFLIVEVVGRQLAYANRWELALRWMKRALQFKVQEYGILRRNLLVTTSEGVAVTDPVGAVEYTKLAVEVCKSAGLEFIRVVEALGEHSISLWYAGRREDSFVAWQEAIDGLLKARDNRPSWTQAFLAFLHAAGYFSGVSLWGKVLNPDYVAPKPGLFLALDNMPVEKYQPIQDDLLLLRTAMFAEGVGQTSAAAKWAKIALDQARKQPGADMLQGFGWLPIPDAVMRDNYSEAIQLAYAISQLRAPDAPSLRTFEVGTADEAQIQQMYSPRRMIERGLLFGLVPVTFRLATLRFDRDINGDVGVVVSILEQLSSEVDNEWRKSAALIKLIFFGQRTWRELQTEGDRYYTEGPGAFGIMSLLGSLLASPLKQSLYLQIKVAKDLEQLFKVSPSIRHSILEPFFVRFWMDAVSQGSTEFRTAAAYTSKSYAEAASGPTPKRLKRIFASMVFCTGLSVPEDLKTWLDAVE